MKVALLLIVAFLAPKIWDVLVAGFAYAERRLAKKPIRSDAVRSVPYLESSRIV